MKCKKILSIKLILEKTVSEIKVCVEENKDKQKRFEDRPGHLEANLVKVEEMIDKTSANTKGMVDKLELLEVRWSALKTKFCHILKSTLKRLRKILQTLRLKYMMK